MHPRDSVAATAFNSRTRFVYHRVPAGLTGSALYPLNELKEVYPEVAAVHQRKYQGREALLSQRIPRLNCLWNDVLHFSAVRPVKIRAALVEAGHTLPLLKWFEVDVARFSPASTVIWEYRERPRGHFTIDEREVLPFEPGLLDTYSEVGEWTHRYYAGFEPGARFLLFVGIAHVLYKGPLDVEGIKVVAA